MMAAAAMAVENAMERVEAIAEAMAVVAAMAAAAMAVEKAMESVVAIAEAMAIEKRRWRRLWRWRWRRRSWQRW